ncbi:hypothetical protein AB0D38_23335 [Streptomyces sp. NPDC048279]|uniref:hypothetical protein n=1 Tax=Streptomyces sp. NPDC048279 TaxID=3154714 RepID=UPI0034445720
MSERAGERTGGQIVVSPLSSASAEVLARAEHARLALSGGLDQAAVGVASGCLCRVAAAQEGPGADDGEAHVVGLVAGPLQLHDGVKDIDRGQDCSNRVRGI